VMAIACAREGPRRRCGSAPPPPGTCSRTRCRYDQRRLADDRFADRASCGPHHLDSLRAAAGRDGVRPAVLDTTGRLAPFDKTTGASAFANLAAIRSLTCV
jgi:hypothetical protein